MKQKPNLLVIMTDSHCPDVAGFAGDPNVDTRHLDQLAERSVRFDTAYCASPICTPSRMCMLTGKEPQHCAAWGNHWPIFDHHTTWPGHFAQHGYATALIGKMHFGGKDQMQGFQTRPYGDLKHGLGHQPEPLSLFPGYHQNESAGVSEIPESLNHEHVVTRETLAHILEHQDNRPAQPWFVCASYTRPHAPLTAPGRYMRKYQNAVHAEPPPETTGETLEPYAANLRRATGADRASQETMDRALQAYYACLDFVDDCIGDLLRGLEESGALQNTIVIYTSDHGDMIGRRGMTGKSVYFEDSVTVPLLISLPGTGGRRRAEREPVSLIDLFPTTCRLTGLPVPEGLDGTDRTPLLRGKRPKPDPEHFVTSMLCRYGAKITYVGRVADGTPCQAFRVVRTRRWKYVAIEGGQPLLFDMQRDPREKTNLAGQAAHGKIERDLERKCFDGFSWKDVHRQLKKDRRTAERHASGVKPSTPNQYRLPDGRIFDAESALYDARWLHIPPGMSGGIIPQQFG